MGSDSSKPMPISTKRLYDSRGLEYCQRAANRFFDLGLLVEEFKDLTPKGMNNTIKDILIERGRIRDSYIDGNSISGNCKQYFKKDCEILKEKLEYQFPAISVNSNVLFNYIDVLSSIQPDFGGRKNIDQAVQILNGTPIITSKASVVGTGTGINKPYRRKTSNKNKKSSSSKSRKKEKNNSIIKMPTSMKGKSPKRGGRSMKGMSSKRGGRSMKGKSPKRGGRSKSMSPRRKPVVGVGMGVGRKTGAGVKVGPLETGAAVGVSGRRRRKTSRKRMSEPGMGEEEEEGMMMSPTTRKRKTSRKTRKPKEEVEVAAMVVTVVPEKKKSTRKGKMASPKRGKKMSTKSKKGKKMSTKSKKGKKMSTKSKKGSSRRRMNADGDRDSKSDDVDDVGGSLRPQR
jgi:hypothetical protein